MSKRRRERATIIPRGHKFAVVIDRGTVNGKRVRDWHSGFVDYKSADRARTKLLAQLDANTYTPPSVLTVGAYLEDKWLPALRGQVKRPRTYSFHARQRSLPPARRHRRDSASEARRERPGQALRRPARGGLGRGHHRARA
jgi:hypothetical protein